MATKPTKHKVFISYHHENDQWAKDELLSFFNNDEYIHDESLSDEEICKIFIDKSVHDDDIDDELSDEEIRKKIRDEYLRDSTVTILLVGTETKNRKHIDWELYSSMYDGKINKKSGILVIQLPSTNPQYFTAAHGDEEKNSIYDADIKWCSVDSRTEYERRYPYLPARIIDNLLEPKARISVVKWADLTADKLGLLIELTFRDRNICEYDLSRPMRDKNS